ncbi:PHD finger protein 14 isoform X4 [Pararge aegeria]|uniref:PHD finger protein 14 isoform X4 n=1 Tax=Pararge aegeria TaxID=116150 RepID=UPI0019D1B8BA|nr:PHD finger protein 14 isoform X4 [Pararge aegeria]
MSNPGRNAAKRQVKPVEPQSLLDFDLGEGESSDDSDFRIEDHPEESDDYSINSDDDDKKGAANSGSSEESGSEAEENYKNTTGKLGEEICITDLLEKAKQQVFKYPELANVLICAGCLGSRSDDYNEIVECDGCGVTVHEGCYGVSDVASESSTISSASTEPWFCEACKAGVTDPNCELCPNKGGIFKETEVGAWVHLVCALYVPGVAFSEVERLSGVTLFEMAYSRWGARSCALCSDATLARTGVCVGCDAGLCKTFFHVTCGQREGLLAEAHSEEAEQADPFYAHCRLHSDKALVKKRKRNWLALQLRTDKRKLELQNKVSTEEKKRIQRKLIKYRKKYSLQKENRNPPWVPTQKMARMIYSSASAMRKFQRKAVCMGVDTHALEFQDAQMAALKDVSRRWHVPPAFSVEFVGYYLERNTRVSSLRKSLERLTKENEKLVADDEKLRADYDEASKINTEGLEKLTVMRQGLQKIYDAIIAVSPKKTISPIMEDKPLLPPAIARSTPKVTPQQLHKRSISVPTAAALKMGVGFPLSDNPDARQGKVLSTSLEENISPIKVTIKPFEFTEENESIEMLKLKKDKRVKAKKEYTSTSGGESEISAKKIHKRSFTSPILTNTPLMSITPIVADSPNDSHNEHSNDSGNVPTPKDSSLYSQNLSFTALLNDSKERDSKAIESSIENTLANLSSDIAMYKANRKRRKEKHRSRYSPDLLRTPSKSHKHKRKKKTQDVENPDQPHPRITIKIKPIPKPDGSLDTQMFYVPTDSNDGPPPTVIKKHAKHSEVEAPKSPLALPPPLPLNAPDPLATTPVNRSSRASKSAGSSEAASTSNPVTPMTQCDVCGQPGDTSNLVRCDECSKRYHFTCLEPPLNKNPKKRGYSWHCADCDPTDAEENNN